MFKPNIGQIDRLVRIIAGVILIALGVLTPNALWVAFAGAIALFSGLFGFCLAVGVANCCCKKMCKSGDGEKKSCGCASSGCGSESSPPPAPPAV